MAPLVIDTTAADDPRDAVHRAVQALVEGKVVVLPTETVYIAAASALNERAVDRLLALRGGVLEGPATLAVRSVEDVLDYVPELPAIGQRLARRCWPGPVTLQLADAQPESVIQRLSPRVRAIVAPEGQIRLRVPAHELVLRVLRLLAGPLVMIGARRETDSDSVTAQEVLARLADRVDLILDEGRAKFAQRSSIVRVDQAGFEMVRHGVFSETNLRRLASWMAVMVCTGNTCRSPMAEMLLRKRLADKLGLSLEQLDDHGIVVMSAGISAAPGGRAAAEAIGVMRERGLDLTPHESQPLSDRLVRFADLILTMTRGHRDAILTQWPDAEPRTYLISQGRGDVSDPIGGPTDLYRRCAEQIDAYLAEWIERIELPQLGQK
ncbi:MAG: Sua5/YciO/YrdC/YwlC family protein [Pirellulaceae bacterium]|jgi:protein-tyrosine phosphatase|nr:Sua5/YciO/YrdC/YwlC family protein [Pirellulaceae bacterium]